ncbi:hypothetical protein GOP47_0025575 [Adiantum capillus-veneris]|uniref:Uncharacterized protein n=1 Tax=Adiantum capillus-veneris TaxID=13818 RepID=A0A9D4U0E4_ADICA|nr:hypothetical protein GOP47_0025575 [Adiantum capillus-veneris]
MALAAGIGYALLALGPAFALFVSVIAAKPILVLLVLSSTLIWLVSLILLSAIWRAFLPLGSSWLLFLLLFTCVLFQEVIRPVFWFSYKKLEGLLNMLAHRMSKPELKYYEKMQIALAGGLGHGIAHAVFFCLSLLTPSFGKATFYAESCSQMPLFLVAALLSLSFLIIHTSSMIVAFNGYDDGKRSSMFLPPAIHFAASFMSLINLSQGGCLVGVPLVLLCAAAAMCYCGKIVWVKSLHTKFHQFADNITIQGNGLTDKPQSSRSFLYIPSRGCHLPIKRWWSFLNIELRNGTTVDYGLLFLQAHKPDFGRLHEVLQQYTLSTL